MDGVAISTQMGRRWLDLMFGQSIREMLRTV